MRNELSNKLAGFEKENLELKAQVRDLQEDIECLKLTKVVSDGVYIAYPEGSDWDMYQIRQGRVVSMTSKCNTGLHMEAKDSWSRWVSGRTESAVDHATAEVLTKICCPGSFVNMIDWFFLSPID